MTHRLTKLSMTLGLALMLAGCTTVQKWAAGGAAVGAGVGGWLGSTGGILNAGEGALVGAGGGGLAGALVGDQMQDKQDAESKQMLMEKDSQIAQLQQQNKDLSDRLAAARQELAARDREIARLRQELANKPKTVTQEVKVEAAISVAADVLFKPGSADLTDVGKQKLDEVVDRVKASKNFVMVEGHTDTDPVKSSAYMWKSNWELGAGRSLAVLHYLIEKGVAPSRLSAGSFGQYQPVGMDKAQNRRAVIVLYENFPRAKMM